MGLDGFDVGAAALVSAGDDAGVGAEGVDFAQLAGFSKFASEAGGEDEANTGDAGE